jgi:hypothetical protein
VRYRVEVQHSSDRQRDGVWHELEATDDRDYAVERLGVFGCRRAYGGRPLQLLDTAT